MTLRTTTSLLYLALLAGCPAREGEPNDTDDPGDTDPQPAGAAAFADATDDELVAAVAAGVGYLPVIGWSSTIPGMIDSIASNGECPSATENGDGSWTWAASDCTGESGQSYDGSFTGTNLPDLFGEGEPNDDPMSISFDGWTVEGLVVDGTIWQSEAQPEGPYTAKADLTVTLDGLPAASVDTELACSFDASLVSTCTSDAPAVLNVEGLGEFTVAGPWKMDAGGAPVGQISLLGADTLTLDLDGFDPETGCIPAEVDGEAIADVCIGGLVSGPVDPEPTEVQVMGSAVAPVNDELELTLWTLGPVDSVDAELVVDGSDAEIHPLGYVGENALEEDTWSVFLTEGDYVAGVTTALEPLSNADGIAVKLRAYDDEGEILGCGFAGTVWGDPNDYFEWDDCPGTW